MFRIKKEAIFDWLTPVLFVISLIIYLRPYYGIRHDAVLYFGQVLFRESPISFSGDLFFSYGSQVDFTIFPTVLSFAFKYFDSSKVFMLGSLIGVAFFYCASFFLTRKLFGALWFYCFLSLIIFPGGYGGYGIFSYAEAFLTARTFAEPLALLSLYLYLEKKYSSSLFLLVLAALLHPLQAVPCILMVAFDFISKKIRSEIKVGLFGLFGFLLFLIAIDPTAYDAEWWGWVIEHNRQVLLSYWTGPDLSYLVADFFWVILAFYLTKDRFLRQFLKSLLFVALSGFCISFILVDVCQLVFSTGLQLWRVQWLLHWVAMACVPYVISFFYFDGKEKNKIKVLLLLIVALSCFHLATGWHSDWHSSYAPTYGASPFVIYFVVPVFLALHFFDKEISPKIKSFVFWGGCLFIFSSLLSVFFGVFNAFKLMQWSRYAYRPEYVFLSTPLVAVFTLVFVIWAWRRFQNKRYFLNILVVFFLCYAVCEWDHRSVWTKNIESNQLNGDLNEILPIGARVYWPGDLVDTWVFMKRSSYFNSQQLSGVLFNRETGVEGAAREASVQPLLVQQEICRLFGVLDKENSCVIDKETVSEVCRLAKGNLDYIVLNNEIDNYFYRWFIRGAGMHGDLTVSHYLYRCSDFLRYD